MTEAEKVYKDIINMPHHVSTQRRRMSAGERAAQFGAFAALTGYDDKIDETAREHVSKINIKNEDFEESC